MKKNNHTLNQIWDVISGLAPYLVLMLVPLCLFWLFNVWGIADQTAYIQPLMWVCILAVCGFYICKSYISGWKTEDIISLIITLGLIMRVGYMLYTHMYVRAHDVGYISEDSHGHIPYVWKLYTEHRLPESNSYQFYHPPFYHIASTLPVGLTALVLPSASNDTLVEASKIISCFASCAGLLVMKHICEEISLKRTGRLLALGIFALHPTFILMGGRINNDALVTFFMLVIVLYTIRWYHEQSVKNTAALAFAFGFGMMTKLSAGTLALFTAPVMLYVWWKRRKTPEFLKILKKGILFLAICMPLALWYPIRNLIKFDQPLNYVPLMSTDHPLYVGNYSFSERFLSVPIRSFFNPLYCIPEEDYSVIEYLLKNSVFGEFTHEGITSTVPILLVLLNVLLIVLSLIAMVYVLVKGKRLHPLMRFGMPFLWLIQYGSYLIFQLQYPFGCTMDFRYIPLTVLTGALLLGSATELLHTQHEKVYRYIHVPMTLLVILFGALSITMYCSIS